MLEWIKRTFAAAPDETAEAAATALSVADLIALNQQLGREQEAVKARRRVIAAEIDKRLATGAD